MGTAPTTWLCRRALTFLVDTLCTTVSALSSRSAEWNTAGDHRVTLPMGHEDRYHKSVRLSIRLSVSQSVREKWKLCWSCCWQAMEPPDSVLMNVFLPASLFSTCWNFLSTLTVLVSYETVLIQIQQPGRCTQLIERDYEGIHIKIQVWPFTTLLFFFFAAWFKLGLKLYTFL